MKIPVNKKPLPQLSDIIAAQTALEGIVKYTPLERSKSFSEMTGAHVYLKLENFQSTGSFKVRGAYYTISKLTAAQKKKGVMCASAGNHAQGVAYAASKLGVKSTIFMPVFTPPLKVIATRSYGGEVVLQGETFDEAFQASMAYQKETGKTFVHPYNDPDIIAGTGTIGMEIFEQFREVQEVLIPIGGGGLISGMAIALKNLNPDIKIIGVEAEGAESMRVSRDKGKLTPFASHATIADGIAVKSPGNLNFEAAERFVDDIVVVDDAEIAKTVYLLLQRTKILAEPAGVASMAALLSGKHKARGKNVVAVISGGNINMSILEQILDKGVMDANLRARIAVLIPDQAGMLRRITIILERMRASIHDIEHERSTTSVPVGYVQVTITFNLQDTSQLSLITDELKKQKMDYKVLR